MAVTFFQPRPDSAGAAAWCHQQHTQRYGSAPAPGGGHNDWLTRFTRFCNVKGAPLPDVVELALTTAPEGHDNRKITATVKGIYRREQAQHGSKPYTSDSGAHGLVSHQYKPVEIRRKQLLPGPVPDIPLNVVSDSLRQYEHNTLARLLGAHFGISVARELCERFRLGTSAYWPGACVFWLFDEQGRARGGQVVQYDETGHTVKFEHADGKRDRRARPVHTVLQSRYRQRNLLSPDWLTAYAAAEVPKSPCLFGLPQLVTAKQQQVALVESAKTAIWATPYLPQYTWLATMGLGMLTADRLTPLKNRRIVLFPDAGALARWTERASALRRSGFDVTVSEELERCSTEEERRTGLDLADVLLREYAGYPPSWDEH